MSVSTTPGIPTVAGPEKNIQKEVNVRHEDQMRINLFARKNIHLCDLKEQITEKEKELQNLNDASDDLMLADDDIIPYLVGEVYVHMTQEKAQEALDKAHDGLEEVVCGLKKDLEETQKILSDLKVQLYAKFGDSINLEADDS